MRSTVRPPPEGAVADLTALAALRRPVAAVAGSTVSVMDGPLLLLGGLGPRRCRGRSGLRARSDLVGGGSSGGAARGGGAEVGDLLLEVLDRGEGPVDAGEAQVG